MNTLENNFPIFEAKETADLRMLKKHAPELGRSSVSINSGGDHDTASPTFNKKAHTLFREIFIKV